VRIKFACRDAMEVPESAEGNLGLYIYDFFYEREALNSYHGEKSKDYIRIEGQGNQHSPK
jgi:hypothetical protein